MELNIPMNTQGSLSVSDLASMSVGSAQSTPNVGDMQTQLNTGNMQTQLNTGNMQPMNMGAPAVATQQSVPNMQPNVGVATSSAQQQMGGMGATPVATPQNIAQPRQRPQGGGVILKKGQKVPLASSGQSLNNIDVCLGWDVVNVACDLDASAFMLGANDKVIGDDWFVFYGQTNSPDNSVWHSGDSQGEGVGDDEIISISLAAINPNVKKIVFVVTIDEALAKGLNFSMVQNAYVRVVDKSTNAELVRFSLTDYYANVTSMVVGEVYNHNGQWKFNAVGDGVARDLAGLCEMYGVTVAG